MSISIFNFKFSIKTLQIIGLLVLNLLSFHSLHANSFVRADMVEMNKTRVSAYVQPLIAEQGGVNFHSFFERALSQESSFLINVGLGKEFELGAAMKWNPYPQTINQPSISLLSGVSAGKSVFNESLLSLHTSPLISYDVATDAGYIGPYASMPLEFTQFDGIRNQLQTSLVLGVGFEPYMANSYRVSFEMSFNVKNTDPYIAMGVSWDLDSLNGYSLR